MDNSLLPFEDRRYQSEARNAAVRHILDLLKNNPDLDMDNEDLKEAKINTKSALLEMATWSGKTYVVWTILDRMLRLRNRYNRMHNKEIFWWMNILILSNRIDGLEQFRDDLFEGRNGKPAIVSDIVLSNMNIKTYHSKADSIPEEWIVYENDEEDIDMTWWYTNGGNVDNVFVSTYQTAVRKELLDRIDHIDIVIIDEAHNVSEWWDFHELILELAEKWRDGNTPMILPVTATPDNKTFDVFGETLYRFWLADYIASEYCPAVDYRLVTSSIASKEEIQELYELLERWKREKDVSIKKNILKELEDKYDELMSKYPDMESLVKDMITRLQEWEHKNIWKTMIFVNNTDEADDLAKEINKQYGGEIAMSYHSKNDKNGALDRFGDDNDDCKIIISVWKLNESVDVPVVRNVVFLRSTESSKIFFQQMGRALRWNGEVRFLDYVGWLKHFVWLWEIHNEYKKKIQKLLDEEVNVDNDTQWSRNKFSLLGEDNGVSEHQLDLGRLGLEISRLKDSMNMSIEDYKNELLTNYGWLKLKEWEEWYEEAREEAISRLLNLKQNEIEEIEINGNKIKKIWKKCEWEWWKLQTPSKFKKFVSWLYGLEYKEYTKEDYKNELLTNYGWLKLKEWEEWYEEAREEATSRLLNLKQNEIKEIEINGNKIEKIWTECEWKWKNLINTSKFKKFVSWLYGLEYKEYTKEDYKNELLTNYGWLKVKEWEEWYEEAREKAIWKLLGLSTDEIREIKINGNKIEKIWKKCEWEWWNLINTSEFKKFVSWLYGVYVIEFIKQNYRTELLINYGWLKVKKWEEWYEEAREEAIWKLLNLKQKEIKEIEINGNKIEKIWTECEWKWWNLQTPSEFKKFVSWLYGLEYKEYTKEDYKNELLTNYGWLKVKEWEEWYEEAREEATSRLLNLKQNEIREININGNKIEKIWKKCEWKWWILRTPSEFKKFVSWLYGVDVVL